mmetsp:Transcript_9922/g.13812  ORF Transcript_9922/g.13812 Transcript_9922/m.13812 type:complete len:100 (-) Transcript_9922:248-547(-)
MERREEEQERWRKRQGRRRTRDRIEKSLTDNIANTLIGSSLSVNLTSGDEKIFMLMNSYVQLMSHTPHPSIQPIRDNLRSIIVYSGNISEEGFSAPKHA